MIAIAAIDNNWGIGYGNKLLFSIPEDMKHFKALTENKTVIMGHQTLLSLPGSKPLKNRKNIILSRNADINIKDSTICASIPHLMESIRCLNKDDVFVIGGQTVYEQLLDYCNVVYITQVRVSRTADRFFPNVDIMDNWEKTYESNEKTHGDIKFVFTAYVNTNPRVY
jgi:dihydrofolate reductase